MTDRGIKLTDKPDIVRGNLRALRDQVVVKPLNVRFSETIEVDWKGQPVRGRVMHVGPGKFPYKHYRGERDGKAFHVIKESAHFRPSEVAVGDVVELGGMEINGYSFPQIILNGETCLVCSEQDIAAVHEQDCDCKDCAHRNIARKQ